MIKLTSRFFRLWFYLGSAGFFAACLASCDMLRLQPKEMQDACESHLLYKWAPMPYSDYYRGHCSQKDLRDYFYDSDPALQRSVEAIKNITETEELDLAWERLRTRREIDLTPFPEITDLRPFSNLIYLKTLTLPPGATILTLAPLSSADRSTEVYAHQSLLNKDEFEIVPDNSVKIQSCYRGGGMVYGKWITFEIPSLNHSEFLMTPRGVVKFCSEHKNMTEIKD